MLFGSFEFILAFLPATLVGFYVFRRFGGARPALGLLTVASFIFYGWWNPAYLLLLAGSIIFNYAVGLWLSRLGSNRLVLALGVGGNLGLLGFFKATGIQELACYGDFLASQSGMVGGHHRNHGSRAIQDFDCYRTL